MPSLLPERSLSTPVNQAHLNGKLTSENTNSSAKAQNSSDEINVYVWVFCLLVDAMNYKQRTIVTEAKNIASNASQQSKINKAAESINFSQIPDGNPGQATINRIQERNVQYNKERADLQNSLILARQNGQVMMTNANTYVGQVQQDASEDTGWLQTLNQIGQSIIQMTQNMG